MGIRLSNNDIRKLRKGDNKIFEKFRTKTQGLLLYMARNKLYHREDCDRLLRDLYKILVEDLGKNRINKKSFPLWIYRTSEYYIDKFEPNIDSTENEEGRKLLFTNGIKYGLADHEYTCMALRIVFKISFSEVSEMLRISIVNAKNMYKACSKRIKEYMRAQKRKQVEKNTFYDKLMSRK